MVAATIRLTRPAASAPPQQGGFAAQVACIGAFYVFHVAHAAHFYGLIHLDAFARLDRVDVWLDARIGNSNWVMNPLLGGVLPALAVVALGARREELGLTWGRFVTRTSLLWCAVPGAIIVYQLACAAVSPGRVGFALVDSTLQAAIGEELFDRGVIQSRLERFGPAWAVVGSSILFGLSHVPMHLDRGAPDLLTAAARCMLNQTMMGMVFALLFWRTRSLLPSTLLHILSNTAKRLP